MIEPEKVVETLIERDRLQNNGINVFEPKNNEKFSPINGVLLPRGPGRSKNAGNSVREWVNTLVARGMSRADLRKLAADDTLPFAQQQAALRLSRANERPTVAMFEEWLQGTKTLQALEEGGVDTTMVKKAKIKFIPQKGGDPIEEREIECYDRSLAEAEWLVSHTDGKATQRVEVTAPPAIQLTINVPGLRFLPPTLQRQIEAGAEVEA